MKQEDFQIEDVIGDGNCFYQAIQKQFQWLRLGLFTHSAIRTNLASFLEHENANRKYAVFIAQPVDNNLSDMNRQDMKPRSDTDD